MAALAGLVCDMKLDIWSLKRQEDSLDLLMQFIADLLLKHSQTDALDACLRALVHCTTQANNTIQVCHRCSGQHSIDITTLIKIFPLFRLHNQSGFCENFPVGSTM